MTRKSIEDLIAAATFDTNEFDRTEFAAAILKEYDDDINVREIAVSQRDEQLKAANDEVTKWKVKNFDLLQQIPQGKDAPKPLGQSGPEKDPETEVSVDDLFGKRE